MAAIRLYAIIAVFTLAGCATLPTNGKPSLVTAFGRSSEQPSSVILSTRHSSDRNSLAIVQKYYAAVAERDIGAALALVAYDVVLVEIRESPCPWRIVKGQQAFESQLERSGVLAFGVADFRVEGNTITYTLTEWLDPRVVGPNIKQPVRSQWTAVVKYGEIANFTLRRDSRTC